MKKIRFVRAINEALQEELARDKRVCLIGEDIGAGGGAFTATRGLLQEFGPKRVIDTPISESSIVGMSLGMAITGLRPVVEIMFMDFLTTCMDPLVNGIAKARYMSGGQFTAPVTIRTPEGGGGCAGPQHSQCLEAWFAHVPGLKVVLPSTPFDAKGLLKSSIRDDNPVIFIEHKYLYSITGDIPEEDYVIPLGQADIKRVGKDVTVLAFGSMVHEALKAADELAKDSISIEVIDPRTIAPFDKATLLASVRKTGRLVIVHEAVKTGGVGAEIAATVAEEAFDYLDAPVTRIGAAFSPLPFSKPMESFCLPAAGSIVRAVKKLIT